MEEFKLLLVHFTPSVTNGYHHLIDRLDFHNMVHSSYFLMDIKRHRDISLNEDRVLQGGMIK